MQAGRSLSWSSVTFIDLILPAAKSRTSHAGQAGFRASRRCFLSTAGIIFLDWGPVNACCKMGFMSHGGCEWPWWSFTAWLSFATGSYAGPEKPSLRRGSGRKPIPPSTPDLCCGHTTGWLAGLSSPGCDCSGATWRLTICSCSECHLAHITHRLSTRQGTVPLSQDSRPTAAQCSSLVPCWLYWLIPISENLSNVA